MAIPARERHPLSLRGREVARRNRFLWIIVSLLLLSLVTLVLLLWVRTRAKDGYGTDRLEQSARAFATGEGEERPAALLGAYPSPFRPAETETKPPEETVDTEEISKAPEGKDEVVYHSRKNDRMEIALSFDDGPHPRLTPMILEILREYGIRATFFMVGENVGYYPAAARAVASEGHEIANHTFSHRKFDRMSEAEMRQEISACEEAIASVSESPAHFVRPPEGQMSEEMRRVVGTLDYRIILWDVDTRDWAHTPPREICKHILDTVQAGDIILMHDFIGYNSPTPDALRLVIPALLERGYRFVTVGELVNGD